MCRASAFAYYRLNVCSEHSWGYSIKYGSAITAYQAGCNTTCTWIKRFPKVSDSPLPSNFVNSNSLVPAFRIGNDIDSVTKIHREITGSQPSSPSVRLSVAATALYFKKPAPSGTAIFHFKVRLSLAGAVKKRMIWKSLSARQKDGMSFLSLLSRKKHPTQIFPSPCTDGVPGILLDKSAESLLNLSILIPPLPLIPGMKIQQLLENLQRAEFR